MSDAIRATVSEFLAAAGVTFTAAYVGETVGENDWKCDEWRVRVERPGKKTIRQPYFTGLGHRKPSRIPTKYLAPRGAGHQWERPQAPDAATVLHSLLMDGSAVDMSFADWCDNYGCDNDSLKALSTYNECCAIGKSLRQFFTSAEAEALRTMLEDF